FRGIRVVPALYQTLAMLVFAYVVLFLPQAVGAIRTSLLQVSPSVEEASATLNASRRRTLVLLLLPLSWRGAAAGGALVFLTIMKELPATLLLAPTGFDTLAVRVWSATQEAFYARASVPALLLILLASVPLMMLVLRDRTRRAVQRASADANTATSPSTSSATRSPRARSSTGPRRDRTVVPSGSATCTN